MSQSDFFIRHLPFVIVKAEKRFKRVDSNKEKVETYKKYDALRRQSIGTLNAPQGPDAAAGGAAAAAPSGGSHDVCIVDIPQNMYVPPDCSRSRQRAHRLDYFIAISPGSSPHVVHRIPLQPAVHQQQPSFVIPNHQQPTTGAVHQQQPITGVVHHQQPSFVTPNQQQPSFVIPNHQQPTTGAVHHQQPNIGNLYHQTQPVGAAPIVRFDSTPVMHSGETPNVQNMGGRGPLRNPYNT
jgi:hypothetical protein